MAALSDGNDPYLSADADCASLASTLYHRSNVGAAGHGWDCSKNLCVGIHLDVIKPEDRKRTIINCYVLDGLNALQWKLLCMQYWKRYG